MCYGDVSKNEMNCRNYFIGNKSHDLIKLGIVGDKKYTCLGM